MLDVQNGMKERRSLAQNGLNLDCRFDLAGKLRHRTDSTRHTCKIYTYAYDEGGRLTSVHKDGKEVEHYEYNAAGQCIIRNSHPYECSQFSRRRLRYDQTGKLINDGERSFCYNSSGALCEIWDRHGQTLLLYGNDSLLDRVRLPNGLRLHYEYEGTHMVRCHRHITLYCEYQWNAEGRLSLFRDYDVGLDFQFEYTHKGHASHLIISPFSAHKKKLASKDVVAFSRDWLYYMAAKNRKKRIQTFLQRHPEPLRLFCACDQVGTLRLLTDAAGQTVKSITRDSFGNVIEDSFPDLFVPLGFAGGLEDRYTGLTHFGWRDYDPRVGRFTCPDPAKDLRGDGDLYDYCMDDPVNHVDPSGLWTEENFEESRVSRDEEGRFDSGGNSGQSTQNIVSMPNEITFTQALLEGLENVGESGKNFAKDLWNVIQNPRSALKGIAAVLSGYACQIAGSDCDSRVYSDAVTTYVLTRYGNFEKFKKTLSQDPVGVLADLSLPLSSGGGAFTIVSKSAQLAGKSLSAGALAGATRGAEKTAQILGKGLSISGNALDPLTIPSKVLRKGVEHIARTTQNKQALHNVVSKTATPITRAKAATSIGATQQSTEKHIKK